LTLNLKGSLFLLLVGSDVRGDLWLTGYPLVSSSLLIEHVFVLEIEKLEVLFFVGFASIFVIFVVIGDGSIVLMR
jgi:hypothetical protein